jgi:[acyl-carrier-protein] S-malonyltransferase
MAFGDAIRVVRARGRMMQEAVPVGVGTMAAIVGLEESEVESVCAEVRADGEVLAPANFNGGGQIVVAGHTGAVDRAAAVAQVRGARLVRRLPVSAPFHCALMAPAARALAALLRTIPLRRPAVPVVSNIDGAVVSDPGEIAERLAAQVAQPVRWDRCMRTVAAQGCLDALEVGPGNTLSALTRRMEVGIATRPAGTLSTVRPLLGGATA